MKVLGISMGRKNERCDIYCKQALMGVEAAAKASGKDIEMKLDRIYHERNACSTDYTIVEAVFIVAEFVRVFGIHIYSAALDLRPVTDIPAKVCHNLGRSGVHVEMHHGWHLHGGDGNIGRPVYITHGVTCFRIVAESTPLVRIGETQGNAEVRQIVEHFLVVGVHY